MFNVEIQTADKEDFAVSNIIYSNTDIEMWYDWEARLDDTRELKNCYWVISGGNKIAGFVINGEDLMYSFLIPPFNDRLLFWDVVLKKLRKEHPEVLRIVGALEQDVKILRTYGYEAKTIRQVMCCPTGIYKNTDIGKLPDGFKMHNITQDTNFEQIAQVLYDGYIGGVQYEVYGVPELSSVCEDIKWLYSVFKNNSFCFYITDESDKIAAVCIAGLNDEMALHFAEISEICVLPAYRGQGIVEYMLKYVILQAAGVSLVVKLCVTVGNAVENLYRKLGFFAGPVFTNMTFRKQ